MTKRRRLSSTKGKQKASNTDTPSISDRVDNLHSDLKGDTYQIKRNAPELSEQEQSTVDLGPDHSSNITTPPRPRQLPNEIVSMIIDHIPRYQPRETLYQCTLVTHQFHAIANPLLWHAPYCGSNSQYARLFTCLYGITSQQRRPSIHRLSLSSSYWTDNQLSRLLPLIPSLTHLFVCGSTSLTDASFQHLPSHCQHLTSLRIDAHNLSQVSFAAIGQYCNQLCDFEWEFWGDQSPEWLGLLHGCPLKRLKLTSPHVDLNEKAITIIKTSFRQLTCLHIGQWNYDRHPFLLLPSTHRSNNGSDNATMTTTFWPHLETFTLRQCRDMDDATLFGFLKAHPQIQHLHLMDARKLTGASFDAMAVLVPTLTRVTLTQSKHISSLDVRRFICRCPRLEYLALHSCRGLFKRNDFPELFRSGVNRSNPVFCRSAMDKIRKSAR